MGKKAEMDRLGAKLTNVYWGWDGVRSDGSIVFIGWEDNVVRSPGERFNHAGSLKERLPPTIILVGESDYGTSMGFLNAAP
jgi:hypothetical protein